MLKTEFSHWNPPCISPADNVAKQKAQARLDILAKPPGSLGGLEEIAVTLAGITGKTNNLLAKRRVIVLAADNGVVEEGVSSAPQSVTAAQTLNILEGVTGVAVLAKVFHAGVEVIDVGICAEVTHPDLLDNKIRKGTGNIAKGHAMERDELETALNVGIEAAQRAKNDGCAVIGVGEMGIGNTTTSSAVLYCLLGLAKGEADQVCGRGAGLSDEGYAHKLAVIEQAIAVNHPDYNDPLDILQKVGGLDLAAMTGVFLGAAACRLPVVIDGFISVVAALCAARLVPHAADYMFASHQSHERGYAGAAKALGVHPYLALDMRLGEGSGCPLLFAVMDGACAIITNMATFGDAGIDEEYLDKVQNQDAKNLF